jgi:hypothetical protein
MKISDEVLYKKQTVTIVGRAYGSFDIVIRFVVLSADG